jgi:hypothetical protein
MACSGQSSGLTCGPGTVQQGTNCVASGYCDPGTHLEGTTCVADVLDAGPPIACGQGTVLQGTTCVLASGDGGLQSTWGPSVRVAAAGVRYSESPRIAVNSAGEIFLAGMEGPGGGVLDEAALWVSRDHGQSFTLLQVQSAVQYSRIQSTSVAIDPQDRVAWSWIISPQATFSGRVYASFSDDGVSFSPATQVSVDDPANPVCGDAWLSTDRAGIFYLSWTYGSLNSTYRFGGRFAQTSGPGTMFGAPIDLVTVVYVTNGYRTIIPAGPLAFDPQGVAMAIVDDLTYDQFGSTTTAVIATVRRSGAGTKPLFSQEEGRYFSVSPDPKLVNDSRGGLTAAFVDGVSRQEQIYIAHSGDGASWDVPAPLDEGTVGGGAALPWLAVDEQDRIHAIWLDNRSGAWMPYTALSRDGQHFEASEQVGDQAFVEDGTPGRSIGDHLSLVVRGGQRYAAWTDTREGSSQIRFATSPEPQ